MSSSHPSLAGKLLANKYRLIRELSRGGMGQVYLAEHIDLEEPRAIKVIREELVRDEATRRRFLREIRATHRVSKQNEHVVFIYDDYGFQDGIGFYVMEFLDGKPLSRYIQQSPGRLPVVWCLAVIADICGAMYEIHQADVIHRDLKPDNLIVLERPGKAELVKVVDFGIAKLQDIETRNTSMTQLVGTVSYMSPEQIAVPLEHAGGSVEGLGSVNDHRSDIYSLGCILFEMLTGRTPFAPDSLDPPLAPHQLLWSHLHDPPPPVSARRAGVPAALDQAVLRALEKRPEDRYQTMREFEIALREALEGHAASSKPQSIGPTQALPGASGESPATAPHPRLSIAPSAALAEAHSTDIPAPGDVLTETRTLDADELIAAPSKPGYDPYVPTLLLNPWHMHTQVELSPWESRTIPDSSLSELQGDFAAALAVSLRTTPETPGVSDADAADSSDHTNAADSSDHTNAADSSDHTNAADTAASSAFASADEWASAPSSLPPFPASPERLLGAAPTAPSRPAFPDPGLSAPTLESPQTFFPDKEEAVGEESEASAQRGRARTVDPMTRRQMRPFLLLFVLALALGGWAGYWWMSQVMLGGEPIVGSDPSSGHPSWRGLSRKAHVSSLSGGERRCPSGMVHFASARFLFGSATNDELRSFNEASLQGRRVQAFCIDTHEYPGKGTMPKTRVTFAEAKALCVAQGKRLCSEVEWERACKGESIYRYPYGNRFEAKRCNTRDDNGRDRKVVASGSFPLCRNTFGLYDMSGNVAEWTDSLYRKGSQRRTIRGGAANRPDWAVRCASRSSASPSRRKATLGFRCCATPLSSP